MEETESVFGSATVMDGFRHMFEADGQLVDALELYKLLLEEDPSNYVLQFRCGIVCNNLGYSKSALKFLSKSFELQPDLTEAIVERGGVYLKLGDLNSAKDDYNLVLQREPSNREVALRIQQIDGLKQDVPFAKLLFKEKDYAGCKEALDQVLAYGKAIADIRATLPHRRLKAPAYLKLSSISYTIGDTENSLIYIRECLKLDPDHKECDVRYKKMKTLVRLMESADKDKKDMQNAKCIRRAQKMLQTESTVQYYVMKANFFLCHCHLPMHLMTALAACDFVLEADPDNGQARMDRAGICMEIVNEKLHQPKTDYLYTKSRTEDNTCAADGLKKAKELLTRSEKRDYYMLLGLDRFASNEDILRAYKLFAMVWHPDKFKGDDKMKAEKMFVDITAAKEVLTDRNKRAAFDRGEDPLAPSWV